VLKKLEDSGLGCFISFKCYNSYLYCDDIVLLSVSVTDMQLMFNVCCTVFDDLDLPINVSKCHCLRVGPRYNVKCCPLAIQGSCIEWVESTSFLGVTICQSKTFKCVWDDAKSKFYCSSNVILGRLGTSAPSTVLLRLIYSQGVQNLLYGISAATLTKIERKSFSHAYNSVFAKIFNTYDNDVILNCQYYSGYLCFDRLYDLHRYLFLSKLFHNAFIDEKSVIDKIDFRDYCLLQNRYNFNWNDSIAMIKHKVWKSFSEQLLS